jgi:SAM-dependent methyltransferase
MRCRMCKSTRLYQFLDLGSTPPADGFLKREQLDEPETYFPLKVNLCEGCGLVQLSHVVDPKILYQRDYPYESSTTRTGREHWNSFAKSVVSRLELGKDDLVVDIGSNVGVLLEAFRDNGTRVKGVDPAPNIVEIANQRGINTDCAFFGPDAAGKIVSENGKVSVATSTNVFAHVDDLDAFVQGIQHMLNDKGVYIFEAPYLGELLKKVEYDTIYHEHLSYISVKPLVPFFRRFGLEVFHIDTVSIHGGSIRVYVGKQGQRPVSGEVARYLDQEARSGMDSRENLDRFAQTVRAHRRELNTLLHSLKAQGKRIAAVSAPAKGMTLLNYCGIGTDLLEFVTEKSRLKIGRYTPGTHVPVVEDAKLMEEMPDYALVLAWNFGEEIMRNLSSFREKGGKFIIPIPKPTVVG